MEPKRISTIDEVIAILEIIILETIDKNDSLGYFAVLYYKVTKKVKEGIENGFFEDCERMESLDVVFAKRYIDAYYSYKSDRPVTKSWAGAFELSKKYWPIVLQHLLVGMNAHISLDLGIAAAEISRNKNIDVLETDFNRINEILAQMVNNVQEDLSSIWPTLKKILQKTRKVDDFLINFSMVLARDGAWRFAKSLAMTPIQGQENLISTRDKKVAEKIRIITNPGFIAQIILGIIRLSERGSVAEKIEQFKR